MNAGEASSARQGGPLRAPRSLRIIIVDDERDMVITLATLLKDEGHVVQGLYRAQEVMSTVKEFDPDVVILDIALPDGSGYALAEQIRRRHGAQRPMLIALTGVYSRPPHDKLYRIVGCDYFLTKPFALDEVLRLIEPLTLESGPTPR
jgi:DNA-binding response OmpR family regulator